MTIKRLSPPDFEALNKALDNPPEPTEALKSLMRSGVTVTLFSSDAMQRADDVAYEMREYYEANRPLRWWEKRNPPGSWGCIADELMLGLRNIVLDAEREYRASQGKVG